MSLIENAGAGRTVSNKKRKGICKARKIDNNGNEYEMLQ